MYKSFLINYAKNMPKEDLINYIEKNNILISVSDIDTVYNHIKKYYLVFFDEPIKYIKMLKGKIDDDVYYEILMLYDKYKKYL